MKAIGKRGKLLLVAGVPVALLLVASLYLAFHKDALQADFDKLRVGMTASEVDKILMESGLINDVSSGDLRCWRTDYREPDSFLIPSGSVVVVFDPQKGLIDKSVHRPGMDDIWNHWKRQLGL